MVSVQIIYFCFFLFICLQRGLKHIQNVFFLNNNTYNVCLQRKLTTFELASGKWRTFPDMNRGEKSFWQFNKLKVIRSFDLSHRKVTEYPTYISFSVSTKNKDGTKWVVSAIFLNIWRTGRHNELQLYGYIYRVYWLFITSLLKMSLSLPYIPHSPIYGQKQHVFYWTYCYLCIMIQLFWHHVCHLLTPRLSSSDTTFVIFWHVNNHVYLSSHPTLSYIAYILTYCMFVLFYTK